MVECTFTCSHCHKQWTDEMIIPMQICHCGRIIYGVVERERIGTCECCKTSGEVHKKNKGLGPELVCDKCLFGVEG